jgi:predicted DCC family thiol-disulfide oxidoreductase YuxK
MEQIVVIYDGDCQFCKESLTWLQQKVQVTALAFNKTDVTKYGLTLEQCQKSVFTIHQGQTKSGASAIAYLLKKRGNKISALIITSSGFLARRSYTWISTHRNSKVVRLMTKILRYANGTDQIN